MRSFIQGIPKAELHIHIEGALEPDLMFELADRNEIVLSFASVDEARKAYQFADLQSFLDLYYEGSRVLLHEHDFHELTWRYLERAHADGVRHVEIFFDPQSHSERGVTLDVVMTGILGALRKGETELDISFHLIMCFLRHLSAQSAERTLEEALRYSDDIVAVGLDSSEAGHPPGKFKNVFDRARSEGFLTVAHAGEEGPADYIWEAIDQLGVSRIDHGVRCIEDPVLVKELRERQIPLTVCPLSNVKLRVFDSIEDHNLAELMELGLLVTVNSDDPAYFGGYIADNFLAAQESLQLGRDQIARLARNSFEAAFLDGGRKAVLLKELEAYLEEG